MKSYGTDDTRIYRPLVFIVSALSIVDPESTDRTNRFYRYAVDQGVLPVATVPIYAEVMDENDLGDRDLMLWSDNVLIGKADQLWVLGEHIDDRMQVLIALGKKRHKVVRYFNNSFEEVKDEG